MKATKYLAWTGFAAVSALISGTPKVSAQVTVQQERIGGEDVLVLRGVTAVQLATPATNKEKSDKHIPVQKISPHWIAWWLDPAHNPKPLEVVQSKQVADYHYVSDLALARPKIIREKSVGEVFVLPEGVESVVTLEPQNALLVRGTQQGIQKMEQLVAELDKPLPQVEIEAQFIEVNPEDAKTFGVQSNITGNPANNQVTTPDKKFFTTTSLLADLHKLVQKKRAKIITAPRLTIINGLVGQVKSNTRTPVKLDIRSQTNGEKLLAGEFDLVTSFITKVSAVINNNETITVRVHPIVRSAFIAKGAEEGKSTVEGMVTQSTSNATLICKDGDTMPLFGLAGASFLSGTENRVNRQVIIFVTARIVRRADEQNAVARVQPVQP